jgi:hypothetical protein
MNHFVIGVIIWFLVVVINNQINFRLKYGRYDANLLMTVEVILATFIFYKWHENLIIITCSVALILAVAMTVLHRQRIDDLPLKK